MATVVWIWLSSESYCCCKWSTKGRVWNLLERLDRRALNKACCRVGWTTVNENYVLSYLKLGSRTFLLKIREQYCRNPRARHAPIWTPQRLIMTFRQDQARLGRVSPQTQAVLGSRRVLMAESGQIHEPKVVVHLTSVHGVGGVFQGREGASQKRLTCAIHAR